MPRPYTIVGVDTIDLSSFTLGNTISLVPGTSSTVSTSGWSNSQLTDNLGITSGTFIENIKSGSGDDVIVGNDKDNIINGGGGNDTMTGGSGLDIFEYTGNDGNDIIKDFIVGEDKLLIKDGSTVLTASDLNGLLTTEVSGADLVLTLGSTSITLEGRAGATFGEDFIA